MYHYQNKQHLIANRMLYVTILINVTYLHLLIQHLGQIHMLEKCCIIKGRSSKLMIEKGKCVILN